MNFKAIKNIFKSQIFQYVGIRYIGFGVQFINAILIAKNLGVYYFGIYSFIILVNQYLIYIGTTPSYALNAILSTKKNDRSLSQHIWNNALLFSIIICLGIVLLFGSAALFSTDMFPKYHFNNYILFVFVISILSVFNQLYINLYRVYGQLKEINFNQLVIPVLQLGVIFFATGELLLLLLLFSIILANAISMVFFIIRSPLKHHISYNRKIFNSLLKRGFYLLLYNVSFYLILLSSRTIVSIFYNTAELGYYTLSVNVSNAIFMIIGSISFVFYPKLLNKFHNFSCDEAQKSLAEMRSVYVTGCYLLTFLGFFIIPVLRIILPQYTDAMSSLKILLLAQLIVNNIFGYSVILVAKKDEKNLTFYALIALSIVVLLGLCFSTLNYPFLVNAIVVGIGFFIYSLLITKRAMRLIDIKPKNYFGILIELYPYYYLLPFLILVFSVFINFELHLMIFGFLVFLGLNYTRIIHTIRKTITLFVNGNSLKF